MSRIIVLAALALAVAASPAAAQKTTLRIAAFTPERSMTVTHGFKPWMEGLKKDLGDEIALQGFWGGSLGRNPAKQLDLLLDGIADVASVVPGYTPGKFPGFSIFELPYLFRSSTEGSLAIWRMYEAGLLKGFEDVKVVGFYATDPYGIHTKTPIQSLDDIKGFKLRTAGPVQADTVKFLGAVPVGLTIIQAPEALSRGVIDGVVAGYSPLKIFRMDGIAKYHYSGPLSLAPLTTLMNKEKWESLPEKVKKAIDKYGGEAMARAGGHGFDTTARSFKAEMGKSGDHHFLPWDESKIDEARKRLQPVHDNWIKNTKNGQKMHDALLQIIADIRAGK